ncbi:peptidase M61 [Comamonadaceae bacterium M7527]|nr:peptidase M61 [Comamonadaceae bacterium M7527]
MATRAPVKLAQSKADVSYTVGVDHVESHLFHVELRIAKPARQQLLSLPVWIAGSYLVREFSGQLQSLSATQGRSGCVVHQRSKNEWMVSTKAGAPLTVRYAVYAFDASVRTAYLDQTRGFFNPTSLCLRVAQTHAPLQLTINKPAKAGLAAWRVSTALLPQQLDGKGFGRYVAANYDELADTPVTMGDFWRGQFKLRGVVHQFVVTGMGGSANPGFDTKRLLADTKRICEAQMALWHGTGARATALPFDRYVFMLHASGSGYGGLEHKHSTALICQRADLPRLTTNGAAPSVPPTAQDGYTQLLGLISHEYFHTWNVKRMRPAELASINYDRENYTELLWFFEGFTSYFDDLLVQRAGLFSRDTYLELLTKTINQVAQTPGRLVQSVAQSSFDAWVKYYRINENTPNATVSYYTKGALVALCLDLCLRSAGSTLDQLMRRLWVDTGGGPMREQDVVSALKQMGHADLARQLLSWVHSTNELPVAALLAQFGVQQSTSAATTAQQLGVRVQETNGLRISHVQRGSAAEAAGLASGDEWLAIAVNGQTWRVNKLADVLAWLPESGEMQALVNRDGQVLTLALQWPAQKPLQPVQLRVVDEALLKTWLSVS